jgi:hypothetical protein
MLSMKHARNTLLVIAALIVPGGSLLLAPLLKKQYDNYRARAARRQVPATSVLP